MSTSTTDTAKLPVTVATPVGVRAWTAPGVPVPPARSAQVRTDRRQLREARRRERRRRRLVAATGLAVIAAFLAATVVVVGVVR